MADLSAQLPALIRGIYFEGWKPEDTPVWERQKANFVSRIEQDFAMTCSTIRMRQSLPSSVC
jgi:uncharacterized protein (DUF2267 family)